MNWAEESNSGTRSGFYTFSAPRRGQRVLWRLVLRKLGNSMRWRMGVHTQAVRSSIMLPGKLRCLEVSEHAPKSERRTWDTEEAEVGTWARTPRQS